MPDNVLEFLIRATSSDAIGNLKQFDQALGGIEKSVGGAKMAFTEINSAIAIGKQVWASFQKVIDQTVGVTVGLANTVRNMSSTLGTSSEESSRLIQVFDDFGVEADQLKNILDKANKNGFSPTIENLAQLADKTNAMTDPTERAAALAKIFGLNWADVSEVLRQGGDAIRAQAAAVSDSLVLTPEAIQQARDYEIALDNWNDKVLALKVSIGSELLPAITALLDPMYNAKVLAEESELSLNALTEEYKNAPPHIQRYWGQIIQQAKALQMAKDGQDDMRREILRSNTALITETTVVNDTNTSIGFYAQRAHEAAIQNVYFNESLQATKSALGLTQEQMDAYRRATQREASALDAVKSAQQNLTDTQADWVKGVGQDAVDLLGKYLWSGSTRYAEGIAAIDAATGTSLVDQAAYTAELDKAAKDYATGKIDAGEYSTRLGEIATKYEELFEPLEKARKELDLAQKNWKYFIDHPVLDLLINYHYTGTPPGGGGGGGGGGGHPPPVQPDQFGGPVTAGQMVMMNENPNTAPEVFMAGGGGYVFTRQEAQAAMGGGNSSVHIGGITVMAAPGMNLGQLAREVAKEIGKAARSKQNSNAIYSG